MYRLALWQKDAALLNTPLPGGHKSPLWHKSTALFCMVVELFYLGIKGFLLQPNVKQKICLYRIERQMKQQQMSLFLKLGTGVKQRTFGDWHIQRVPCQSCAQSISSSQTVLFVCWICFGTCRPLIDMGAGAGKTLLWCEANNGPSVTLPQMFGLRGYTDITTQQKSVQTLSPSRPL